MTVSLEFGIGYLFAELLAHALVVLGFFEFARAVAAAPFESLFYESNRLFVGVESYFHCSFPPIRSLFIVHSEMFTSPFIIVSYYFLYLKQ